MAKPQIFRTRDTSLIWPRMPGAGDASILVMDIQLKQSQWYDADRILTLQFHQLRGLIDHAFATVPFYNERLAEFCSADDNPALTLDIWRQIPILNRQQVQDAGTRLHSTNIPDAFEAILEVTTSGSMGTPINIRKSGVDQLFFQTNSLRVHRWAGQDFSKSVANICTLTTHTKKLESENKAIPWAAGHVSGPLYHFDVNRPIGDKVEWLLKIKPSYLMTDPSCLEALIAHSQARDVSFPGLEHVVTTGSVLEQPIRERCNKEWGLPVWDLYSAQETGIIATQCPDNPHYHTMAESLMVEVLRDDDSPCEPGEIGRIVVTPLHNAVMPLIRYEIGDYAELGDNTCSCGRGLPVLKRIHRTPKP